MSWWQLPDIYAKWGCSNSRPISLKITTLSPRITNYTRFFIHKKLETTSSSRSFLRFERITVLKVSWQFLDGNIKLTNLRRNEYPHDTNERWTLDGGNIRRSKHSNMWFWMILDVEFSVFLVLYLFILKISFHFI